MLRFNIGSIPVGVQPVFWLLALLLGFGAYTGVDLAIWMAVVFGSVLIHELGHALTAKGFGMQPNVVLHGFGGMTTFMPLPELHPWKRILITLNGPFAGFLLAGGSWLLLHQAEVAEPGTALRLGLGVTIWVNSVWGVLNLVPIRGLDGGHAIEGLFDWALPKHSRVIMEVLYVIFGVAAVVLGFMNGYPIIALFAVYMTVAPWLGSRRAGRAPAPSEQARVAVRQEALLGLLGMNAQELDDALKTESIADVATSRGVSVDALIDLFMPPIQERIDADVASGEISPDEAEVRLAQSRQAVAESLQRRQEPQRRDGPKLGI